MSFIQQAFTEVCRNAKQPTGYYISLMETTSFYGGPQEGGWYGSDTSIVAYQWFATEEEARTAKDAVATLARELEEQSRSDFGNHCLRELEWLEARGLDADFLPEPDGPSRYAVIMTEGIPEESRGCRHYE